LFTARSASSNIPLEMAYTFEGRVWTVHTVHAQTLASRCYETPATLILTVLASAALVVVVVQELGGINLHKSRNNFEACVPAGGALDRILRDHAGALPAGLAHSVA
jgi:hypothetical protein